MSIAVKTVHKAQDFCFIEIIISMRLDNYGKLTVVKSSIIDIGDNGIRFQTMYNINSDESSGLCFVKLTEKEDSIHSRKCILTSCQEYINKELDIQYYTTDSEGDLMIDGAVAFEKQIKADDEWHSLNKFTYIANGLKTYLVKLEFKIPPLQISFISIQDDIEFTDFILHGVDGSVHMHKAVAAAISPYFKTLFKGKWSETSAGVVEVPDTSMVTLQYLKDYMYTGKIPESGDLTELLLLSAKYMMPDLEMRCVEDMTRRSNAESAYDLMEFAVTQNMSQLLFKILELVQNGILNVPEMKKFYK